jgi:RecA/RadA recombinase
MATKDFSFLDLDKALSKISGFEMGSILETNTFSQTDEWISTGNYLLNAQLSGSLFGGIANNRSIGISGDPGTGKSFLCQNVVREAQKLGYDVIYCDTEGAIDKKGALKFGIDPKKIRYQPIKTVTDFKIFTANLVNLVQESKKKGFTPKIMLILDSLGMLTTQKEIDDALKGKSAMDMGIRAKEMRSLFRLITLDLTSVKIPLICTNHTTTGGIGGFMTTKESAGGDGPIFSMSNLIMLSKAVLKDSSDAKTGIIVTSNIKKARFTVPHQVKFHISWVHGMNPYVGLQDFVSWDVCGIQRGKLEKGEFTPVESSPRWAIKHLGKTIPSTQLFTPEVFTDEVLKALDEKVIRKHFELPDLIEESEFEEIINTPETETQEVTQEADV